MATRPIDEIRKRRPLTPERRARVDQIKRAMQLEIALAELRRSQGGLLHRRRIMRLV